MRYGYGIIDGDTGLEEWSPEIFTKLFQQFSARQRVRNDRMDTLARVVRGDWSAFNPADRKMVPKSPNIIQVGLEDTAAATAMVPTVRVAASEPGDNDSEAMAAWMEQLGAAYLDQAGGKLLFQSSSLGAGAYGFAAWNVTNDGPTGKRGSSIEWRDPFSCYPEPDLGVLGVAQRMFFARDVFVTQLCPEHREAFERHCTEQRYELSYFDDHTVTLLEYSDCERVTVGLSYDAERIPYEGASQRMADGQTRFVSVIVEDYANSAGMCRGIYGQLPSLDGEPRGQYDQVIPVLHANIRLVAAALEHAHQAVYNELVVIDPLTDQIPQGPDAVIELGPNGKAYRLPPATVGFSFFEETQRLLDAVHVGARSPKNRPGDVSQSQASSKFVESTLGVQNAVIASHHSVFERMAAQAQRVCFALDFHEGPRRRVAGATRTQQFNLEFDRAKIDLAAHITAEYGLGFGRDVAQSAVLAIQLNGAGIISLEDAEENYPGIVDVGRTRARILSEKIEGQLLAGMLMMSQQGGLGMEQLVQMLRDARKGDPIDVLVYEYVVKPQKEQQEKQLTSGLDGSSLMPGPPPGVAGPEAGPSPPGAPDPRELLAGIMGGGGAPGGAPSTINRLSIPMGDGSFAGSQMGG